MIELAEKIFGKKKIIIDASAVYKITAMWGFSEAVLGGILHALKIPFTGLFVGGAAVLFITLIGYFSGQRSAILKSTLIVILVKAAVSPHTPVTAYLAVFLQGFLGYLLFYNKKYFRISALALGILTLLLSAFQKLLILTILFGNTLWESFNFFLNFILDQFSIISKDAEINFSLIAVGLYIGIHLLSGVILGLIAGKLPLWLNEQLQNEIRFRLSLEYIDDFKKTRQIKKHKLFWEKPAIILLFSFALILTVLSYIFPEIGSNKSLEIILMIIRAIVIMLIWYFFLSPFILNMIQKYFKKKESAYSYEILNIISLFPFFRRLIIKSWKISSNFTGIKKVRTFLSYTFVSLLLLNIEE